MSDHSASPHLKVLFDAALQDYETQTDMALANIHSPSASRSVTPPSPLPPFFMNKQRPSMNSGERRKSSSYSRMLYQFGVSFPPALNLERLSAWYISKRSWGVAYV
jgi:hypothetical protein